MKKIAELSSEIFIDGLEFRRQLTESRAATMRIRASATQLRLAAESGDLEFFEKHLSLGGTLSEDASPEKLFLRAMEGKHVEFASRLIDFFQTEDPSWRNRSLQHTVALETLDQLFETDIAAVNKLRGVQRLWKRLMKKLFEATEDAHVLESITTLQCLLRISEDQPLHEVQPHVDWLVASLSATKDLQLATTVRSPVHITDDQQRSRKQLQQLQAQVAAVLLKSFPAEEALRYQAVLSLGDAWSHALYMTFFEAVVSFESSRAKTANMHVLRSILSSATLRQQIVTAPQRTRPLPTELLALFEKLFQQSRAHLQAHTRSRRVLYSDALRFICEQLPLASRLHLATAFRKNAALVKSTPVFPYCCLFLFGIPAASGSTASILRVLQTATEEDVKSTTRVLRLLQRLKVPREKYYDFLTSDFLRRLPTLDWIQTFSELGTLLAAPGRTHRQKIRL